MRFTLRPARSDDAPATSRLLAELGYRIGERDLRARLERLSDDERVIAMTEGEELIGLAAVTVGPSTGRLSAVVVSRPRRHQGVGRILLAAAEAVASARGCQELEASAAHPGGRRFLRRAGFDGGAGRLVKPLGRRTVQGMAEYRVGLLMLHYGRGPRDEQAREQLAAVLPGAEVTAPDDVGEFEVVLEADSFDAALQTVFDAVAAAGVDDHLVFLEHPEIPGHWRTAPRSA